MATWNTTGINLTGPPGADADTSTLVHNTGDETVQGYKTFVNGIGVASPSQANSAIRNDDPRLSPGATTLSDGATVSVSISTNTLLRLSTSRSAVTINVPTGGTDTVRYLFEITCSRACTVTFASGYELGGVVTSRAVPVVAGRTAYVGAINRGGTYRLLAVDPGAS